MAETMAQNEAQRGETTKGTYPKTPEAAFAQLDDFLKQVQQNVATRSAPADSQGQAANGAANAQSQQTKHPPMPTDLSKVKDGDIFTDANGKQWQYTVMDFTVMPEDAKDEMVDLLNGTESPDGEGGEDADDGDDDEDESSADYDGNLTRGLDVALAILRGETPDTGDGKESGEGEAESSQGNPSMDSALDIINKACDELLSHGAIAEDGTYTTGKPLTPKRRREGWDTANIDEIKPYHFKLGHVSKNPDGTWHVAHYGTPANLKARENARRSHRTTVAASFEDCKAKDPYKCRWHGASAMRAAFGKILEANGLPVENFEVMMKNPDQMQSSGKKAPIQYTLVFATPKDAAPDVRMKCAREFFIKHPSLVYSLPKDEVVGDLTFGVKQEDIDDMPIDAPTSEELQDRQDTGEEASWSERNYTRGAQSYAGRDQLGPDTFFDMLSEHPRNIVELNEDMLRYLNNFPDCVPEGMTMEDIQDLYKSFKAANEAKKSIQAFIIEGEVTDDAEPMSEAVQKGLGKQYETYRNVAQEVYDVASDIFNNVQAKLQSEYEQAYSEFKKMPKTKVVSGKSSDYATTVYFGQYKVKGDKFPIAIGGNEEENLKLAMDKYCKLCNETSNLDDTIIKGCTTREPLLVKQGVESAKLKIEQLKRCAQIMGAYQDRIIAAHSDEWRAKRGIVLKQQGEPKPASATPATTPAPANKDPIKKTNAAKPPEQKPAPSKQDQKEEPAAKPEPKPEPKPVPPAKQDTKSKNNGEDQKETKQKETAQPTSKKQPKQESARQQNAETGKKAEQTAREPVGAALDIRAIEISDNPTMEDAKAINAKFQELEKKLRGLTQIYTTKTSDSKDWQAAESEMQSVKSEIDALVQKAKGKGYFWTKDSPKYGLEGPSDRRPFDLPTNFRLSGIKDASGKTVSVPYTPPAAKEIIMPASAGTDNNTDDGKKTDANASNKSQGEMNDKSKTDYASEFEKIDESVGNIGVGPYGETSIMDLIADGYVVREVPRDGKKVPYLGLANKDSTYGISSTKENPAVQLPSLFRKKFGGDINDKEALNNFVEAIKWKIKQFRE